MTKNSNKEHGEKRGVLSSGRAEKLGKDAGADADDEDENEDGDDMED